MTKAELQLRQKEMREAGANAGANLKAVLEQAATAIPVLTLGQVLQAHLTQRRFKPTKAARLLGITPNRLKSICQDCGDIDTPLAIKLGRIFDTSAETWMSLQAKRDIKREEEAQEARQRWHNPLPQSVWWPHAKYVMESLHRDHKFVKISPTLALCLHEKKVPDDYACPGSGHLYRKFIVFYLDELNGELKVWSIGPSCCIDRSHRDPCNGTSNMQSATSWTVTKNSIYSTPLLESGFTRSGTATWNLSASENGRRKTVRSLLVIVLY